MQLNSCVYWLLSLCRPQTPQFSGQISTGRMFDTIWAFAPFTVPFYVGVAKRTQPSDWSSAFIQYLYNNSMIAENQHQKNHVFQKWLPSRGEGKKT